MGRGQRQTGSQTKYWSEKRDSQSCESYSAANQLTGLCQTNSGVADSGLLHGGRASEQPLASVGWHSATLTQLSFSVDVGNNRCKWVRG